MRGIVFSLISGAAWGTYGIFSTLLARQGNSQQTLSLLGIVTILIYFAVVTAGKIHVLKKTPLRDMVGITLGLGVSNLGANLCYAGAFTNGMPAGVVSTVAFCNIPIVMILSAILFQNRITRGKLLATVATLAGVSMTLQGVHSTDTVMIRPIGLVYTCLIPIFFAQFSIINKYYIRKGRDADMIMMFQGIGGLCASILIFRAQPVRIFRELAELACEDISVLWFAAGFCLIPEIICYAAQQEAFRTVEPAVFSICYAVDPVVAAVLSYLVFGQTLSGIQIVGGMTVLLAVYFLIFTEKRENSEKKSSHIKNPLRG